MYTYFNALIGFSINWLSGALVGVGGSDFTGCEERRDDPSRPRQYYTILYYTILYYTMQCYTMLYYAMLYYTILCYTITILYYIMLCYIILYYTIL